MCSSWVLEDGLLPHTRSKAEGTWMRNGRAAVYVGDDAGDVDAGDQPLQRTCKMGS